MKKQRGEEAVEQTVQQDWYGIALMNGTPSVTNNTRYFI